MTDLASRTDYTASYSGLLSSLYLAIALGGISLVGHETLWRIPRRRGWELKGDEKGVAKVVQADKKKRRHRRWQEWWSGRKRGRSRRPDEEVGDSDRSQIEKNSSRDQPSITVVPPAGSKIVELADPKTDDTESSHNLLPRSMSLRRRQTTDTTGDNAILEAGLQPRPSNLRTQSAPVSSLDIGEELAESDHGEVGAALASPSSRSSRAKKRQREKKAVKAESSRDGIESHTNSLDSQGTAVSRSDSTEKIINRSDGGRLNAEEVRRKVTKNLESRESWEFAYLYQNRCWNKVHPIKPLRQWPLMWIKDVITYPEGDLPDTVGLDITAHSRYLRGCWWYLLLHLCTTLVILLPLHLSYSTQDLATTSMLRAGLSVTGTSAAAKWLWVHVVLIYWLSITWVLNLIWVTWGVLGYRRRQIRQHIERVQRLISTNSNPAPAEKKVMRDVIRNSDIGHPPDLLSVPGYQKYRAVLVTNIPPFMRDSAILRDYFTLHLNGNPLGWKAELPTYLRRHLFKRQFPQHTGIEPEESAREHDEAGMVREEKTQMPQPFEVASNQGSIDFGRCIEDIVLVRSSSTLQTLRAEHTKALKELEKAHLQLIHKVVIAASKYKSQLVSKPSSRSPDKDELLKALDPFLSESIESVWQALLDLPRHLLDPFQETFRKRDRKISFHGITLPKIDYLAAKEQVLWSRIEKELDSGFDNLRPASTAIVIFKDSRDAKRVLRELPSHPQHALGCQTRPCPDYTDLIWPKLTKKVYRVAVARNVAVGVLTAALIFFWIFPVSAIVAISTVSTLAVIFPPLGNFLRAHPSAASLFDSFVPVVLVTLISLSVCPILLAISNGVENMITGYDVHNSVTFRFWCWLIINALLFFCVGRAAVESYVFSVASINPGSVLDTVASSFGNAAPYFASYLLLQTAIQSFFEVFRLGLPLIFWLFSTRKAKLPSIRAFRLENSTVSWFFQIPNHMFAITLVNLFCIFNPLVIPFGTIFFSFANLMYRKNYLYNYGRRYENNGKRNCVRYLRYSLDGLTLMQFAFLAFMILVKNKTLGVLCGLAMLFSIVTKLVMTRIIKAKFDALHWQEAAALDAVRRGLDFPMETVKDELPTGIISRPVCKVAFWMLSPLDRFFAYQDQPVADIDPTEIAKPDHLRSWESQVSRLRDQGSHSEVDVHKFDPLWEDIPPPWRMKSYREQPLYFGPLRRYLWLPRDPRTKLDLEDTIELSAFLTSSQYQAPVSGGKSSADAHITSEDGHDNPIENHPIIEVTDLSMVVSPEATEPTPMADTSSSEPATTSPAHADLANQTMNAADGGTTARHRGSSIPRHSDHKPVTSRPRKGTDASTSTWRSNRTGFSFNRRARSPSQSRLPSPSSHLLTLLIEQDVHETLDKEQKAEQKQVEQEEQQAQMTVEQEIAGAAANGPAQASTSATRAPASTSAATASPTATSTVAGQGTPGV